MAFRSGSSSGNTQPVTSRSVAVPTGTATGDIQVAFLERWQPGVNPAVTPPSGDWTRKAQVLTSDTGAKVDVWWKRCTGADAGSYQFSWGATDMWATLQVLCFSGRVDVGDPFGEHTASTTGDFGPVTSLSVSPDYVPDLVWTIYNDSAAAGGHTPPTNFSEAFDVDCAASAYRTTGTVAGLNTASGASISPSSIAAAWLGALAPEAAAEPITGQIEPAIVGGLSGSLSATVIDLGAISAGGLVGGLSGSLNATVTNPGDISSGGPVGGLSGSLSGTAHTVGAFAPATLPALSGELAGTVTAAGELAPAVLPQLGGQLAGTVTNPGTIAPATLPGIIGSLRDALPEAQGVDITVTAGLSRILNRITAVPSRVPTQLAANASRLGHSASESRLGHTAGESRLGHHASESRTQREA